MNAIAATAFGPDQATRARLHTILRFAFGTAGAFLMCEAMGWYPSFLAPLLAGVLLANMPGALPFKGGVALILIQAAGAYSAYILCSLLHTTPIVQFGVIAIILFLCFGTLAKGRAFLPILLILIAYSTVPIVTMLAPSQGGLLPKAFTIGMAVAVLAVWIVHAIWPEVAKAAAPPPAAAFTNPFAIALTGTAIVLPIMLVYLMFAITDALPVLITTVVLVINFDPKRGAMQGAAMMIGNFVGGVIAILAYDLLQIGASLATLYLLSFLIALLFAVRIERGGPGGAVALITFNQAMVLFSLALAPGGSSAGLWGTRLLQFSIACTFAIAMMTLLLGPLGRRAERL